jgi:hypothetical protein
MTNSAFARLRAANPAPMPRTRSHGPRRATVVAVAFAGAAVAASGAYAISHWAFADVVKPPVTRAEYARAQKLLDLPPNEAWPVLRVDEDTVTSRGGGGSFAVFYDQSAWECYWVKAIATGDGGAARKAERELDDLLAHHLGIAPDGAPENWQPPDGTPFPYAFFADDGGYQLKQRMYREAAAGRPALLEQSCRANGPA